MRLYQVLALRSLGLGLESIAVCLDAGIDPDQVAALGARTGALGPVAHYLLEVEWPELYRRAERLRAAGIPPDDARVQRLVVRIDELGTWFSGGDREISAGVRAAWGVVPALLIATAVYGVFAWYRRRRLGRQH